MNHWCPTLKKKNIPFIITKLVNNLLCQVLLVLSVKLMWKWNHTTTIMSRYAIEYVKIRLVSSY